MSHYIHPYSINAYQLVHINANHHISAFKQFTRGWRHQPGSWQLLFTEAKLQDVGAYESEASLSSWSDGSHVLGPVRCHNKRHVPTTAPSSNHARNLTVFTDHLLCSWLHDTGMGGGGHQSTSFLHRPCAEIEAFWAPGVKREGSVHSPLAARTGEVKVRGVGSCQITVGVCRLCVNVIVRLVSLRCWCVCECVCARAVSDCSSARCCCFSHCTRCCGERERGRKGGGRRGEERRDARMRCFQSVWQTATTCGRVRQAHNACVNPVELVSSLCLGKTEGWGCMSFSESFTCSCMKPSVSHRLMNITAIAKVVKSFLRLWCACVF